jgi:hypothetical protein
MHAPYGPAYPMSMHRIHHNKYIAIYHISMDAFTSSIENIHLDLIYYLVESHDPNTPLKFRWSAPLSIHYIHKYSSF